VSIEELLALDVDFVVLLTHNHYDHLDKKSMEKFPKGTKVYAPKGLSNAINKMNGKVVHELDWWESADLGNGIRIHSVPAQHWSLRAFSGRNKTLWCSFVVETADGEIFAGGDSGYFKGFREIGRKFSNIRVAFLPIGASRPRWFMHYAHMDSSEMLLAATELGARSVLPIHWGAFNLGEEPAGYPGLEIRRIIENSDHGYRGNIFLPSLGEGVLVPQ
jgi:L-ascorbate metabolism protein UlaG (beta-lactamase superfamily)